MSNFQKASKFGGNNNSSGSKGGTQRYGSGGGQQGGGSSGGGGGSKNKDGGDWSPPPITHSMKAAEGGFVSGVFISENEFGLRVFVKEGTVIEPGVYYINKRKEQQTEQG